MRLLEVWLLPAVAMMALACGGGDETGTGGGAATSGATTSGEATSVATGTGGGAATSTATGTGGGGGATSSTTSSGGCAPETPDTSLAVDVQPILTATCAKSNCHSGGLAKAGLDLTEGASYAELVGTNTSQCSGAETRVVPGDPGQSYLMAKLLGVGMCSGKKMPSSGSISAAEIQVISDWICAGAPDN